MADGRRRCSRRFSVPGTDRRKEVASHESAADLEGQSTVKPEAWALRFAQPWGKCRMPAVLALTALSAFLPAVDANRG